MKTFSNCIGKMIAVVLLSGFLISPASVKSQDRLLCQHQVIMYDMFGDGWNDGTLSLFVDGVLVLDSITMVTGLGPEVVYFDAYTGPEITTLFTCGTWCYECSYEIADVFGSILASDGLDASMPIGIPPGICFSNCTTMTQISESEMAESVKVFPNPTNDFINIESESGINSLYLLDECGHILQSYELQNKLTYSMDVSSYEPGVYLLRIDTEQGRLVRKIVVN